MCSLNGLLCSVFAKFSLSMSSVLQQQRNEGTSEYGSIDFILMETAMPYLPTRRPGFDSRRGHKFLYLSWDFVCVLYRVLSCVVSGGAPDIVLTTHSGRPALVYVQCSGPQSVAPVQASHPQAFFFVSPEGVCPTLRDYKYETKE